MTKQANNKKQHIWMTYSKYVVLSCLKRPYTYIPVAVYLLYLAIVLLIIPAAMNFSPLYLWTNSSFNFPVFNLILVAIITSCLTVAVFKRDREDGSDLLLSVKPVKKWTTILIKMCIYLIGILIFTGLSVALVSLTKTFGEYGPDNLRGIDSQQYVSLLLSILVGNIINMLIFGSIATIIAALGPSLAVLLGTIGLGFVLSVLNFIFPRISSTPSTTLETSHNLKISTYSANTVSQYIEDDNEAIPKSFATIDCYSSQGVFDTYEYWNVAKQETKSQLLNYVDLGKQLSMLYQTFGMNDEQIKSAKKLNIGASVSYDYQILKDTSIKNKDNVENNEYPIGGYLINEIEGVRTMSVALLGNYLSKTLSENWSLISTIAGLDFYSVGIASTKTDEYFPVPEMKTKLEDKTSFRLSELKLSSHEKNAAKNLYDKMIVQLSNDDYSQVANQIISADDSNAFFQTGTWDSLPTSKKYRIIAMIQVYWAYYAQQRQIESIQNYKESYNFPFSSEQISDWFDKNTKTPDQPFYYEQRLINCIFSQGIKVEQISQNNNIYSLLNLSVLRNCDTFNNLYQYDVLPFFDTNIITIICSVIGVVLFAASSVIYYKSDIK